MKIHLALASHFNPAAHSHSIARLQKAFSPLSTDHFPSHRVHCRHGNPPCWLLLVPHEGTQCTLVPLTHSHNNKTRFVLFKFQVIYVCGKWHYFFVIFYLLGTSTISHRKALQCQAGRKITKVGKNQKITLPSCALSLFHPDPLNFPYAMGKKFFMQFLCICWAKMLFISSVFFFGQLFAALRLCVFVSIAIFAYTG